MAQEKNLSAAEKCNRLMEKFELRTRKRSRSLYSAWSVHIVQSAAFYGRRQALAQGGDIQSSARAAAAAARVWVCESDTGVTE